jgi:hypothetical protein
MRTQLSVIQFHQSRVWSIHDDADDARWSPPHRAAASLPRQTHELLALNRRYAATNGASDQSVLTRPPCVAHSSAFQMLANTCTGCRVGNGTPFASLFLKTLIGVPSMYKL